MGGTPHPRLRLRNKFEKGATLTFRLVQKIGQVTVIVFMTLTPDFVTRSEIFLVLLGLMVRAKRQSAKCRQSLTEFSVTVSSNEAQHILI